MALRLNRAYKGRKKITQNARQATIPGTFALVTAVVEATPVVTVTFDQPVILNGVPTTWVALTANLSPVSAEQTGPNEIELTFGASVAAMTGLKITPLDPAVRTRTGGFASASAFPVTP